MNDKLIAILLCELNGTGISERNSRESVQWNLILDRYVFMTVNVHDHRVRYTPVGICVLICDVLRLPSPVTLENCCPTWL